MILKKNLIIEIDKNNKYKTLGGIKDLKIKKALIFCRKNFF